MDLVLTASDQNYLIPQTEAILRVPFLFLAINREAKRHINFLGGIFLHSGKDMTISVERDAVF